MIRASGRTVNVTVLALPQRSPSTVTVLPDALVVHA